MKKTLIAMAALAATGAFAQVTVYGRLDAGYAMTTNTAANVETKANGVQSHNSVSSMWGLKGTEDLGGGMNGFFQLEQDVYTANGDQGVSGGSGGVGVTSGVVSTTTSRVATEIGFNRTALIGVNGGFGSIAFGRDYVPTFKLVGATDVNNLSRISTVQLPGASGNSTQPNLVFYSTPDISGFKLNVAYGNQDSTKATDAGDTSTKITNVTATYTNGPLMVGVGSGTTEVKSAGSVATNTFVVNGQTVFAAGVDKITGTVLAASYDFGKFALKGNAITSKATTATTDATATELNLGATVPMGKATLIAQIGTNKVTATGLAEDMTGSDAVLGVDYALSARTALFAKTGTYAKVSGTLAGDAAYDTKSTSTAIGIKTTF
jgi:predicted porin